MTTFWASKEGEKRKQEMSEKLKRIKKGKKHSEEAKQKMREAHKGRIPWNKGLSKETDERVLKHSQNRIKNKEVKAV